MLVAQCSVDDELSNFDCVEPTLGFICLICEIQEIHPLWPI